MLLALRTEKMLNAINLDVGNTIACDSYVC